MRVILSSLLLLSFAANAGFYDGRRHRRYDPRDRWHGRYICVAHDKAKPSRSWTASGGDPYATEYAAYSLCRQHSKKKGTCYKAGCAYL